MTAAAAGGKLVRIINRWKERSNSTLAGAPGAAPAERRMDVAEEMLAKRKIAAVFEAARAKHIDQFRITHDYYDMVLRRAGSFLLIAYCALFLIGLCRSCWR